MIQSNKKVQAGWAHGGFYQIFIFRFFFHLMQQHRWITFIYRQGGSGQGGGGQGQFDFFCHGGLWGVQNKLEQKSRRGKANFFFYNFHLDYFFFKWEGKAGRGMIQSDKKFHSGWAHGGF